MPSKLDVVGTTQADELQQLAIENAGQVFGDHPASVFAIIKNAAVATENLEVIFGAFVAEMEQSGMCRTKLIRLAQVGRDLAINASRYLSVCCDDLSMSLSAAGVDLRDATESRLPSNTIDQVNGREGEDQA